MGGDSPSFLNSGGFSASGYGGGGFKFQENSSRMIGPGGGDFEASFV